MTTMILFRSILAASVLVLVATACGAPRANGGAAQGGEDPGRVTLVDSIPWELGGEGFTLRRVVVASETRGTDTIRSVIVAQPPVEVRGTGLIGIAVDTPRARLRGYVYDLRHRIRDFDLPEDVGNLSSGAALSPDARHVAYVAYRGDTAQAMVRVWPAGRIVARGPDLRVMPGDAYGNFARWASPDSFSVTVDLGGPSRREVTVHGTVTGGIFAADTIFGDPPPRP